MSLKKKIEEQNEKMIEKQELIKSLNEANQISKDKKEIVISENLQLKQNLYAIETQYKKTKL